MMQPQLIKNIIFDVLKNKIENYKPSRNFKQTMPVPMLLRLLGKDDELKKEFVNLLASAFGTSFFEPMAEELAKKKFDEVIRQKSAPKIITDTAQAEIQNIMNNLENTSASPDKLAETERIVNVARKGNPLEIKPTKIDLFMRKDNLFLMTDIKSPKPNSGEFKGFKRTLLTWVAVCAYENPGAKFETFISMPYNPYFPNPYKRWTLKGLLDIEHELKVAEEFWDFVGGKGSYDMILSAFEEVGIEMRSEIDEYFARFNVR